MSDQEIVDTVTADGDCSDSDNDEQDPPPQRTHAQAYDAFECALEWLEAQGDTDPVHLMLVKKWRDQAAVLRGEAQKQIKISSYFNKT